MMPPLSYPESNEAHLGASSLERLENEDEEATLMMRAGAKISQYSHVSASDQARQHIGDVFHGPVTLQHVANTSITATVSIKGAGRSCLMESLVFNEMDARFIEVHPNLVGTCEWLSETPEYKKWMDPEQMNAHHGFFWIKGKAGAGKSTLMKHASTHAEAQCSARQHVLNFFFHARGGSFEISTNGLFRSLLYQLLQKVPAVYDSLDKRRLRLVERQGWSSALLKDTFREAVLSLGQDHVTCYIDAMDECRHDDIEPIIQYFDDLGDSLVAKGNIFYVCLSSRHYPNLRFSKSVELVLDSQYGHDQDIQQYIHERLLIDRDDLKRDLAESIRSRAYGVFLWVVLVVTLVNQDDRNGNAAEIYQRLDQIPTGLSDLFNELIERGTTSDHLRPLIQWVTFGIRPLTPTELYCILMKEASRIDLKSPVFEHSNLAKFILSASKGLVETTTGPWPRVQFIHESLRTYFLGKGVVHLVNQANVGHTCRGSTGPEAQELAAMTAHCHDQLKERCLDYIMQIVRVFDPSAFRTRSNRTMRRWEILTNYPFAGYASHGVMKHANTALDLGLTQKAFMDNALPWNEVNILQESIHHFCWGKLVNIKPWYKAYTAAKFACPKLLKAVLETQPPFEASPSKWGAILRASIEVFDVEGVEIALQAGADPNAPLPKKSHQSLQYALYQASKPRYWDGTNKSRRWNVVELLLKHGARPYATSEGAADCLCTASRDNELRIVRILLGEHLKADTHCSHFGISLAYAVGKASAFGHDEMLRLLLDKGADTGWWSRPTHNATIYRGAYLEVKFGDMSILRRILEKGARIAPSTGATSRLVLKGALIDSTDVIMHFKQGSSRVGSQS